MGDPMGQVGRLGRPHGAEVGLTILGLNLTPCLRSLTLIASILGALDTGGSKALAVNTIHRFSASVNASFARLRVGGTLTSSGGVRRDHVSDGTKLWAGQYGQPSSIFGFRALR